MERRQVIWWVIAAGLWGHLLTAWLRPLEAAPPSQMVLTPVDTCDRLVTQVQSIAEGWCENSTLCGGR